MRPRSLSLVALAVAFVGGAATARAQPGATDPTTPATTTSEASEPAPAAPDHITSGVLALLRIDGHGRGVATGIGVVYAPESHVELELALLISEFYGGYAGIRYRFLTGVVRPYATFGVPMFVFDDGNSTDLAPGVRIAAGLELGINRHLSIHADLGYEHFFNVDGAIYKGMYTIAADLFVPTIGVVGRL